MNEKNNTPPSGFFSSNPPAFPRIFQNPDILTGADDGKKIPLNKLINKINYLNFSNHQMFVIFSDRHNHRDILVKARPQPCTDDYFTCLLEEDEAISNLHHYQPRFLMIDDGLNAILSPVHVSSMVRPSLTVQLPEESFSRTQRTIRRRSCKNVACTFDLGGKKYNGTLIDSTPLAFSIELSSKVNSADFDQQESVHIDLYQSDVKLFSGPCRLVRNGINMPDGRIVCRPLDEAIRLFPQRKTRNPRRHTALPFTIGFQHPLSMEHLERDIFDVSASGFSIRENPEEQSLLVGLIIPEISINYAGVVKMACSAQVVYRRTDGETGTVQTGLAITDMDVLSYSRLNHLIGAHLDVGARVSTTVEMDALWQFFFDTGFIYGEKYQHLYPYRDVFRETYRKLYQDNPDIVRHFTYEKNGKIYGHIAMVHAYVPCWVMHHFSAKPMESKVPSMLILKQLIHYLNGCYLFRSTGINYVMTYYRPDNRIVDKIFGGFARELNNPKGSSLDLFSYLHWERSGSVSEPLTEEFVLSECMPEDFEILKSFYDVSSGGLLMEAFGLPLPADQLKAEFFKAGFKRNYRTLCLCRKGKHLAFFIVNQSDLGLNLSDLFNGIKIFIMNEKELEWKVVESVLQNLAHHYSTGQIPLLIYPDQYLANQGIEVAKRYLLWIMKTNPYGEDYMEYMRLKFRIKYDTAAKT